jgi:cytochrome c oxidase subunit II
MSLSTTVVNGALIYILAFCALLFFLIIFFMVYFLVRYRKSRNPLPSELKESSLIEASWVIVPTLLVMTMFLYGLTGFNFLRSAPRDSMIVKVHARQWSWLFEYSNGKKSPDLIVPLGRNIKCELTSADVIHGFYIPSFRIQQDTMPGLTTYAWFRATSIGTYYILCSQYCGLKHSMMLAHLIVVSPEQFEGWLSGRISRLSGGDRLAGMPEGEKLLYERGCVSCHSLEGGAMAGPTFKGLFGSTVLVKTAGQEHSFKADEVYIRRSILNPGTDIVEGFPNIMPSGRDILTDQEIGEIIKYLKKLK